MTIRATAIIPTFGNARFARWAIESVQNQTVRDIEICIVCDGSPDSMISLFRAMEREDPRIKVYTYPKSPRNGEPYRDIVIKQTTGKIICYCSHDDLWLPNHIEVMEKTLRKCYFAHALPVLVNLPENIKAENELLDAILWSNIDPEIVKKMQGGFGLTFGAHTRKSYFRLEEGWITTPQKDIGTDQYMWCKFLAAFEKRWKATNTLTALNFPQSPRRHWSEQQRDDELRHYFERIQDPVFLRQLDNSASSLSEVEWWDGFSGLERDKETNWRWCSSQGTMIINTPENEGRRVVIDATFVTGYPESANLRIRSTLINEDLRVNNSGYNYKEEIVIPPGRHVIEFSCDARRIDAPTDPRYIVFGIRDFQMAQYDDLIK